MKYPDWAPADLVAWHKEAHRKLDDDHQRAIDMLLRPLKLLSDLPLSTGARVTLKRDYLLLDRFIFSEDAKSLWLIMFRTPRFQNWKEIGSIMFGPAHDYWQICESILDDWQGDPKQTASEKEKELSLIASKARELAAMIQGSSYLSHVCLRDVRLAQDASIPKLSEDEIAEGIVQIASITRDQELSAVISGAQKTWRRDAIGSNPDVNAGRLLERYSHMAVHEVLTQIAAIADDENQYAPTVSRPGSAHAKRQFVARHLRDVHMEIFGSPMWDALALACTLIVDPDHQLTADDVRPYCR